jgi:hypothetical protein
MIGGVAQPQNQAGSGERGCANAKRFHANLTSSPIAKLRFNVVAAAVGCGTSEVLHRIGYAQFYSRSHHAVIPVYDSAGNVIETREHKSDFKEP